MEIVQQLIEIVIRKREPQDLTHNTSAAIVIVLTVVGLGTLVYSKVPQFSQPLAYNLCMAVIQAMAIYGLLSINKKASRYVQTITAIFGVSLVLQILAIGLGLVPALALLGLVASIWNMVLIVIILRSALECSTLQAAMQTIGYHIIMVIIVTLIFPKFPEEIKAMLEAAEAGAKAS